MSEKTPFLLHHALFYHQPTNNKNDCRDDDPLSFAAAARVVRGRIRSAGLSAAAAVVGSAIAIVTVAATTVMQL